MFTTQEYGFDDYNACPNKNNPALEGWTKEEKWELLQAIKMIGSHDIDSIHENLLTKTPQQIQTALNYYKKTALRHPVMAEQRRRNRSSVNSFPRIPLAIWANFLTDSYPYEYLQTEIATALRLIGDFECIPMSVCTDNIDFRKIYHLMANSAEGKSFPEDRLVGIVVDKCMVDTALLSKSFIQNTSLKYILQNIDTTDRQMNTFTRPTLNNELGTVQHIAMQENYNPFHIPEAYLKASKG